MTALSWIYLIAMAAGMADMGDMAMPQMRPWTLTDGLLTFVMWAVMMVAMMVPSAAPMVLLFAVIQGNRRDGSPVVPAWAFAGGYLAAWTAFSAGATLLQWLLREAALLSPMMVSTSPTLGGVILLAAGVWQWTPQKAACLVHCRSPMEHLSASWREGKGGAFGMGWGHGLWCLGCCWALMALLFVAGVMNLLWVAAIALFVLVEKLAPRGDLLGRAAGALLVGWGAWMLLAG